MTLQDSSNLVVAVCMAIGIPIASYQLYLNHVNSRNNPATSKDIKQLESKLHSLSSKVRRYASGVMCVSAGCFMLYRVVSSPGLVTKTDALNLFFSGASVVFGFYVIDSMSRSADTRERFKTMAEMTRLLHDLADAIVKLRRRVDELEKKWKVEPR